MRTMVLLLVSGFVACASPVIDDRGLRARFEKELGKVADREGHVTGKDLAAQLKEGGKPGLETVPAAPAADGKMTYEEEVKGIVMLGSVYKCGKCEKWHLGGVATGWVLSADGLMVTNHHVFKEAGEEAYGVMTLDGKFAEVVKVEASDPEADIAIFRVAGEGFTALPLAERCSVGEAVHVISHPDGRHFTYTAGRVSRFYKRKDKGKARASTWMAITADYARGSSGGPVFNDRGEVVGMVSSTSSLYYGKNRRDEPKQKGPLQMVIKNCVSLPELRRCLVPNTKKADLEE